MAKITIRDASTAEDDVAFIVAAFDSTLAPLAALGSGAMWGSTPFSQKDGFVEETIKDLRTSERYYEKHGFRFVAEFEMTRGDGSIWPGALMKMSCFDKAEAIV
ncbi:hypothetical protein K4K49_009793 [Colletotrichum sp. SAR 10_70]|nr:hypothetical protein K4K50_009778 [Colletotrichum sp. SAR 10_71]KAI8154246.1 hypothetical protein K4K49_009793 [Colletotrichum sp. SAR 10_70]